MKRIIKIRTKIIATLLIVGITSSILISLTSLIILLKTTYKQAGELGLESAKYNGQIIESWINERTAILKNTSIQVSSLNNFSEREIQKILLNSCKAYKSFYSIFIGFENNKMIDARGWVPPEDYNVLERPWYRIAMGNNSLINTPIYVDKNKNELVTSIALPVSIVETKGVIAANIPIEEVINQISKIRYGKSGYAILIDEYGNVIASRNKKYIMQPIEFMFKPVNKNIIDSIKQNSCGIETISFENKKQFIAYAPVKPFDWKIILIAPTSEFQTPIIIMFKYFAAIIVISILIILLLGLIVGKSISKPIDELITSISFLAKGDLSKNIEINTNDELSVLSKELNKMRINLNKIFQKMKYESNLLSMNTKKLSLHLEETYNNTLDFISLLSHDLKTPVTLIKGYVRGLKLGIITDKDKQKEYLNRIYLRAEQIENITSDILDSAYEVNKSLILKKSEKDLWKFALKLFKDAKNYIESSDKLFIGIIDIRGGKINVDEIKINRVWNNLITNAIKYSHPKSKIKVSITEKNNYIKFVVKDEGIGIEKEHIQKVFNMFYRVNDDSNIKGYGLGLFISKAIIEAHNGKIRIKSEYKKGTHVSFLIPICHKNDTFEK